MAIKGQAKSRKAANKVCKKNLLHDINLIEYKEEKIDLIEIKYETRGIIRQSLEQIYRKEEIYWKQRAKVTWLKEGDKNSAYFHKVVSGMKRKNHIISLKKNDQLLNSVEDIALKFYDILFESLR